MDRPEHLPNRYGTGDVAGIGRKPESGFYTTEYSNLRVTSLTRDQHDKTVGYWYVITARALPHMAFAERGHLMSWLEQRGLLIEGELALAGEYSAAIIVGSYRQTAHLSYDEFYSLEGDRIRVIDNGDYTLGIIAYDEDDIANVHLLNCNLRDRLVFEYSASRELVG